MLVNHICCITKKRGVIVLAILLLNCFQTLAQTQLSRSTMVPAHPRLLWLPAQEQATLQSISSNADLKKVNLLILNECDNILKLPPVERIKIGKRLLDKSREALRRLLFLGYAYRTTHKATYLNKAEQEMLAIAAFSDWNPSHFLDVAEMTTAMSIGYDWCYNDLSEHSRQLIKDAITQKGIETSLKPENNSWLKTMNNWNQVCNTGMAMGAIATFEDHPDLSREIINRAISTIDIAQKVYAPDGGYPEGYGYWGYGTTFNILLISSLKSAFGTEFGLADKPGFLTTAAYVENMTGPSGLPFNYSDCGVSFELNPAMFWYASRLNQPSLLWVEKQHMAKKISVQNRFLPALMFWGSHINFNSITAPKNTVWSAAGENPVTLMRTSWTDDNALFVGFKGGSPGLNHAHMDAGSFIMEANGVRWGLDLGMQEYETLESKGIDLWNMTQTSQRWDVFRYNNRAHNTLTIDNGLQNVNGHAPIISHGSTDLFKNAVADLTAIYTPKTSSLLRGIAIINNNMVVVRDEVATGKDSIVLRWSMVTPAQVDIGTNNTATLTFKGKKLTLKFEGNQNKKITLKTWSANSGTAYDTPNPGTRIVGFETIIPANTKTYLNAYLIPQQAEKTTIPKIPVLSLWSKN